MLARAGLAPKPTRYGPLLIVALLGSVLEFVGLHWDIAWHVALGRDTFWSPPRPAVYLGVGLLQPGGVRGKMVGSVRVAAT
jgi:hypothetical protein